MNDVQTLVDALAASLRRPIGVDDNRFGLVAYSAHGEEEELDTVRLAKLLQREASAEVTGWLERHGVREADSFVRVPACSELEMTARIIIPLRFDDALVGFLALMDGPEPYSDEEIAEALSYRSELGLALYRERRLHLGDRDPEVELARRLLGLPNDAEEPPSPGAVAALLAARPGYGCLFATTVAVAGGGATEGGAGTRVAASVERLRRTVGIGQALALAEGGYSAAIVGVDSQLELEDYAARLLGTLDARFAEHPDFRPVVGVGRLVGRVEDLHASFEQARSAAALAARVERYGSIAVWGQLGADGTIARLVGEGDPSQALPDSIRRLAEHPDAEALLETLQTYLDNAADTGAAAAALFVHRTSLYHRLRRIEEISGVDLSTGDGRLELHLGLRLRRMSVATGAGPALSAVSGP